MTENPALRGVSRAFAVLGCAWVFMVILLVLGGVGVKHSGSVNAVDRRITSFVVTHRTPTLTEIMKVVTWTGSWIAVLVVPLLSGSSPGNAVCRYWHWQPLSPLGSVSCLQ